LAQTTEDKYRVGQASIEDTLQSQTEVAKRRNILLTEHLELAHARLALNRWLNRAPDSPWPSLGLPPIAPAIPLSDKLLALAIEHEPRLKVLEKEIKNARARADLTRRSRLPDVSLGVEGRQYSGDGGYRSGMFTLRLSLPWANAAKYRQEYERDMANLNAVEQEREDQVLILREALHHLTVSIEAARREALLYRDEIQTRATQALTSRLADWESGRGAFRDVLEARRMVLESQMMSTRAVAEEHRLLADMLLWSSFENLETLVMLANEPPLLSGHDAHAPHR
jgi:outer membrane protein TolC